MNADVTQAGLLGHVYLPRPVVEPACHISAWPGVSYVTRENAGHGTGTKE